MLHYKLNRQANEATTELSVTNGTIASGNTLFLSDDYSMFSGTTNGNIIGLSDTQHVSVTRGLMRAGATLDYENNTNKFTLKLDELEHQVEYTDLQVTRTTRYLIYDTETKVPIIEKNTTDYYADLIAQPQYYVNVDNNVMEVMIRYDGDGNEYAMIDNTAYPIVNESEGGLSGNSIKLYTKSEVLLPQDALKVYSDKHYNDYIVTPGQEFIYIIDTWYPIESAMTYGCKISGNTIELVKDSATGNTYHSSTDPGFKFTETGGTLSYFVVSGTSAITQTTQLITYSGVTYEDNDYIIKPQVIGMPGGSTTTINVVRIPTALVANLKVKQVEEPNCYILTPDSLYDDGAYSIILERFSQVCAYIAKNPRKLTITKHNNILGQKRIAYGINLQEVIDNLTIIVPASGYKLPLLLSNENPLNLNQEYRLNNDLVTLVEDELLEEKRNQIIDMDYDMYVPGYFSSNTKYDEAVPSDFQDVNEIRFNLHFRTRDLETGQVIEDDKNPYTHSKCNWFVTDYYDPNSLTKKGTGSTENYQQLCKDLIQSGDLLGFIGFSDDDIHYQKDRLAKSFIRLSFYDSNDYTTQSLLYHTTIFMNEGEYYGKYMNNNNSDSLFVDASKRLEGSIDLNVCSNDLGFSDYFAVDEKTICEIKGVTAQTTGDIVEVQTYRINNANKILLNASVGDIVAIGNTVSNIGFYEVVALLSGQQFGVPQGLYRLRLLCCGSSHKNFYNTASTQLRGTLPIPIRVVKQLTTQAGALTEKVNTCTVQLSTNRQIGQPIINNYTIPPTLNLDSNRITTQLKTYKNTEQNKCSDGFYLHLFKEYATNLHKRTIYMTVEFNNAANGHTSRFMILKNSQGQMVTSLAEITDEMKEGYDTRVMYKHMFIPIEVIYDSVKKRYTYYFKDNYSNVMNFNLFEVKYAFGKIIPGGGKNKEMVEITVKPNDVTLGSCNGSGYYFSGDTVTISAETLINNACWIGWDDLPESDPDKYATARTITVGTGDTTYIANFEKYYRVHLHSNDDISGTTLIEKTGDIMLDINVTGGTSPINLSGTTLNAFTYHNDITTISIDRSQTGTTRHMIPTYNYSSGVTASGFYLCPITQQEPGHTMSVQVSGQTYPSIQCFDGDIFVRATDKLVIKATPHNYYSLTNVQLNGEELAPATGTLNTFETYVTEDSDLICNFAKATAHVRIMVTGNSVNMSPTRAAIDLDYGTAGMAYATTGVSQYQYTEFDVPVYSNINLVATPVQGVASVFNCWSGSTFPATSSTNPYTVTITGDTDVLALFTVSAVSVGYPFFGDTGITNIYNSITDGFNVFTANTVVPQAKMYASGSTQSYTITTDSTHRLKQYEINTIITGGMPWSLTVTGDTNPFQLLLQSPTLSQGQQVSFFVRTVLEIQTYDLTMVPPTGATPPSTITCTINGSGVTFTGQTIALPINTVIENITVTNAEGQNTKWSDGIYGNMHPDITLTDNITLTTTF